MFKEFSGVASGVQLDLRLFKEFSGVASGMQLKEFSGVASRVIQNLFFFFIAAYPHLVVVATQLYRYLLGVADHCCQ